MNLDGLSEELKAKALACKTTEEVLELAKAEGYELSQEQLEGLAGARTCATFFECWNCDKEGKH